MKFMENIRAMNSNAYQKTISKSLDNMDVLFNTVHMFASEDRKGGKIGSASIYGLQDLASFVPLAIPELAKGLQKLDFQNKFGE